MAEMDMQPVEDATAEPAPAPATAAETAPATAPAKAKKVEKCKKVFLDPATVSEDNPKGETRHASETVESLEFRFANGVTHAVRLGDYPDTIQGCFGWNGLAQKLGDGYAGSDSIEDAVELFETLNERLAGGEWVKVREKGAGARPSMVFEAVIAALTANGDVPTDGVTEEYPKGRLFAIRFEKLKTQKQRDEALANPDIKAHYDRIRREREDAKIAKMAPADLTAF